uniref:Uncharacterized protein TCIL3000_11_12950 n=1 Tax=Trypanosoma congolense (strain IL3000) TaxID=1068625 RepID=G0V2C5_TRYCI|nr:unnamed protein product [Trypanosoma congolense IL3000]
MHLTYDGTPYIEPTGKEKKYLVRFILVAFIALGVLVTCITVPLTILNSLLQQERHALRVRVANESSFWASQLRLQVVGSFASARAVEGLVIGGLVTLPPLNDTVENRVRGQHFRRFNTVASVVFDDLGTGSTAMLAPGGVVFQTAPTYPSVLMYDLLRPDGSDYNVLQDIINGGGFYVVGPAFQYVPLPDLGWQVVLYSPIHNATPAEGDSAKSFWGFIVVVKDLEMMLDWDNFKELMRQAEIDYLFYNIEGPDNRFLPIRSSLPENTTTGEYEGFIDTCSDQLVLPFHMNLHVCMHSSRLLESHSRSTIVLLIVGSVFFSLVTFVCGVVVVLPCLREDDNRKYAPKMVPFAIAIVGPCNAERLCELAPEALFPVLEKYSKLQKDIIAKNCAYVGLQTHPYTATFITRDVDTGIKICLDLLQRVQSKQLDEPLMDWLGEDGKLRIAAAVHWCTDAYIRIETVNGNIRYEGNDISYCERMWMFVPPNKVTISQAAKDNVQDLPPELCASEIGSVYIRGVQHKQSLFIISSTQQGESTSALVKPVLSSLAETSIDRFPTREIGPSARNPLYTEVCENKQVTSPQTSYSNSTTMFAAEGGAEQVWGIHRSQVEREAGPREDPLPCVNDGDPVRWRTLVTTSDSDSGRSNRESEEESRTNRSQGQRLGMLVPPKLQLPTTADTTVQTHVDSTNSQKLSGAKSKASSNAEQAQAGKFPHANGANEGDFVTEALMRPWVPHALDTHLCVLFEQYSLLLDFSYESVRNVIYYFYIAYKELFTPLAGPERTNLFNRFVTAFGVPHQNILESLAVRCALRYIQHLDGVRTMLWHKEQQRLQSPRRTGDTGSGKKRKTTTGIKRSK